MLTFPVGGEDSSRETLLTLDPVKQELQKTELMYEYHLTVGICSVQILLMLS